MVVIMVIVVVTIMIIVMVGLAAALTRFALTRRPVLNDIRLYHRHPAQQALPGEVR
ncbi:MAG: hypothetical protein Q8O82_08080 [Pseudorhodobacter sp.]|nr:hypothetical protein [Pseudorhodobacter sp.]